VEEVKCGSNVKRPKLAVNHYHEQRASLGVGCRHVEKKTFMNDALYLKDGNPSKKNDCFVTNT
jgi:hypothetical protein